MPDGSEDLYAVAGVAKLDSRDVPLFDNPMDNYTLVHEHCHSFVNDLIFENEREFKGPCEQIFRRAEDKMSSQGYGVWRIMMAESLVRACTIKYFQKHPIKASDTLSLVGFEEQTCGFYWTTDLAELLSEYETNRSDFPTLRKFIPNIARFMSKIAQQSDVLEKRPSKRAPKILSFDPISNGQTNVNPEVNTLTIYFDRPLDSDVGPLPPEITPFVLSATVGEDRRTLIAKLKLKPATEYNLDLPMGFAMSTNGYFMAPLELPFKTLAIQK